MASSLERASLLLATSMVRNCFLFAGHHDRLQKVLFRTTVQPRLNHVGTMTVVGFVVEDENHNHALTMVVVNNALTTTMVRARLNRDRG